MAKTVVVNLDKSRNLLVNWDAIVEFKRAAARIFLSHDSCAREANG